MIQNSISNLKKNNINNKLYLTKNQYYKEGFFTKLKTEELSRGISENIIYIISLKRFEPNWMLRFRLNAYKTWLFTKEPHWLTANYPSLNYNKYSYYSAPSHVSHSDLQDFNSDKILNKNYLTKELRTTFHKLGIPIFENNKIAVDAIFDSVSISTTYRVKLAQKGIIFCSFNEAIYEYPKLVKKYLGSVVPYNDNFFVSLNSAMASDGTFIYIPKYTRCPIDLSTYFRINSSKIGQFERTILIAEKKSYISYIEGCSAPSRDKYQLHVAVVEVIVFEKSFVKYSTVQNWFSGNTMNGGVLNFVTKRALCWGNNSNMSWAQSETGSSITWKYPSIILVGDNSIGKFFSVALTHSFQQADTGTKMIHIGKNSRSLIVSKSVSIGNSINTYRGLVKIISTAINSRNFTQCDSILIGNNCSVYTIPFIEVNNNTSKVEHEATTSYIGKNQLFYCLQRGISKDDAISIIVNGFCRDIFLKLPLEFSIEAQKLLNINIKNSVG